MSPNVFNFLRTVLAGLISAIATFIMSCLDKYGHYDHSPQYEED